MDTVIWGLSKEKWEVIGTLANWIAAIGTLAAVFLSLHLARSGATPRAKLSAAVTTIFELETVTQNNFVTIQLVNTGDREIRITGIGWQYGSKKRRRYFVQQFAPNESSPMPIKLAHGDTGFWRFPITGQDSWYVRFSNHFEESWRADLLSLRCVAVSSVGQEFKCRPDMKILSSIEDELIKRHGVQTILESIRRSFHIR
ncbi:hypothetical protein [Pseudomonas sp. F01002]|uniref:hypothetical protein n=1 Tax=Pseudomonas sp. F01002 TaxID=2555724 RepID=UPI001069E2D9|nr:hypothetical protein [Pseudomonas sp. F01002]TFB40942.1 hypothetical protein E3W21_13010 [Pseudomonas sp. F01002]